MYTRKAPPVFGPDTPTTRTSIAVDPGCLAATRMQTFAECVRLQPQRTDLWRTRWSVSARDIWVWWGTLLPPAPLLPWKLASPLSLALSRREPHAAELRACI